MTPPTRQDLERYILDDLGHADVARVEAAIAQDAGLLAKVDRLRDELDAIGPEVPAFQPPWERAPARKSPRRNWFIALGGLTAMAAVMAAVLVVVMPPAPPSTTFRGAGFDLVIHRVRGADVDEMGALIEVTYGDRLQLSVEPAADGFIQVFDLQDDGALAAWVPSTPVTAMQVHESAAIIDNYQGSEKIFVVLSARPVSVDQVRAGLARAPLVPLADLDELPGVGSKAEQRSALLVRSP